MPLPHPYRFSAPLLVILACAVPGATRAQVTTEQVDAIFAQYDRMDTPGCTVGATRAGEPILARAYGMADLEHAVPNTPETILEPVDIVIAIDNS